MAPGELLMMRSYFDDSGTHGGSRSVVWGGILGDSQILDDLDQQWLALLACPLPGKPPLTKFSLSKCRSRAGEFEGYNLAESDGLRHDFRRLILDAGVAVIGYAVDVDAWNDVAAGHPGVPIGTAERFAFGLCGQIATGVADSNNEKMTVIFDEGRKSENESMIEAVKEGAFKFDLTTYDFAPVERTPSLQAADMIAGELYLYSLEWLDNREAEPNPHMKHLIDNIEYSHHFGVMNRESIEATVAASIERL